MYLVYVLLMPNTYVFHTHDTYLLQNQDLGRFFKKFGKNKLNSKNSGLWKVKSIFFQWLNFSIFLSPSCPNFCCVGPETVSLFSCVGTESALFRLASAQFTSKKKKQSTHHHVHTKRVTLQTSLGKQPTNCESLLKNVINVVH